MKKQMDKEEIVNALAKSVAVGISLLRTKVLKFTGFLFVSAAFGFVLYQPTELRIATAVLFAIFTIIFCREEKEDAS